jgi:hypothetical protein
MKKIILSLTLLATTFINCFSQTFKLTSNGFIDASSKEEKRYIIVPFEGKTQEQIFTQALIAIGKIFNSPNNVINKVNNCQINIISVLDKVTARHPMGMTLPFDMEYNLILEFKDGKMKMNAPFIRDIKQQGGYNVHIYLTKKERGSTAFIHNFALFNNNGTANEKKHIKNIENAWNTFVSSLLETMREQTDW